MPSDPKLSISRLLQQRPFDAIAVVVSLVALAVSVGNAMLGPAQHSDQSTAAVVRQAYEDFLELTDLQVEHPLQSHLFAVPENYDRIAELVTDAMLQTHIAPAARNQYRLEELAIAQKIFTIFEHTLYQWNAAISFGDESRAEFLKAVLDYFTGRVLTNHRLLWYWKRDGGNLQAHYEDDTKAFYTDAVPSGLPIDEVGPHEPALST